MVTNFIDCDEILFYLLIYSQIINNFFNSNNYDIK